MPSVNKVFILGALGRDPETRFTNTNLQITSFSVATSTFRKGEDGERKEETEWHVLQLSVALLRLLKPT